MFGVSFLEFILIGIVALVVVGPKKLPGMLNTAGRWIAKARRIINEMRQSSGIDDILRSEGIDGSLRELKGLVKSPTVSWSGAVNHLSKAPAQRQSAPSSTPSPASPPAWAGNHAYEDMVEDPYLPKRKAKDDPSTEYPDEGADIGIMLADDLLPSTEDVEAATPTSISSEVSASATAVNDAKNEITTSNAPEEPAQNSTTHD